MKTFVNFTAYILVLLHLYSCNSDIFVEDFSPSETEITLDGNGDVATIHFASSEWDVLELYIYDDGFTHQFKVYDTDGRLVTTDQRPYMKGLGKMVCDDELTDLTVERIHPKEVKITVGENARYSNFYFTLVARSEYETKDIRVDISPSDRYVIDHITYSLDMYSHANRIEEVDQFWQGNGMDIPYHHKFYPYRKAFHEITFESYKPEAFHLLGDQPLDVEIPVMVDGRMKMTGMKARYTSSEQKLPFHSSEIHEVVIPPFSNRLITVLVEYDWFETYYTLYATHPKSGKQRVITGTLRSKMPLSYYTIQK